MLLYAGYEAQTASAAPLRAASALTADLIKRAPRPLRTKSLRRIGSLGEVIAGARLTHRRPAFGIDSVQVGGRDVGVHETAVIQTPFADLLHFRKELGGSAATRPQPAVLVIAALSGHFATMLRPTVRTLLQDHDVYITDWHNARDVPLSDGSFGLDDYICSVLEFIRFIGPDTHVIAVCQPCNAALAATAILADAADGFEPRSLTLVSGPIDARINPSKMDDVAAKKSLDWFARNCIATVPRRYPGAGRRVYPGFLQVSAFMSQNMRRHLGAHRNMYQQLVAEDFVAAKTAKRFYDEYFAVLDIDEKFYLDTVRTVFQDHDLARGRMRYQGNLVRPEAIERTALMTVEAQNDDMCSVGQTAAAHDLTPGLRDNQRRRHVQSGVGHYGVFAGHLWEQEIYPAVRDFIATTA